jgi:hypothetical protein
VAISPIRLLKSRKTGALLAQVIVAVGILFHGLAVETAQPAGGAKGLPKELKMQSPPDPKNPQKSRPPIPEMVGATSTPFELGKGITTIPLDIHAPTGPALLRSDGHAKRMLLRVENLRSTTVPPAISVYLNLPPGAEPQKHRDLLAATISTFGVREMSKTRDNHPGDGLDSDYDVTELYLRLIAAKDWDGKTLRVSFVPKPWDGPVNVQVGRVSLWIE